MISHFVLVLFNLGFIPTYTEGILALVIASEAFEKGLEVSVAEGNLKAYPELPSVTQVESWYWSLLLVDKSCSFQMSLSVNVKHTRTHLFSPSLLWKVLQTDSWLVLQMLSNEPFSASYSSWNSYDVVLLIVFLLGFFLRSLSFLGSLSAWHFLKELMYLNHLLLLTYCVLNILPFSFCCVFLALQINIVKIEFNIIPKNIFHTQTELGNILYAGCAVLFCLRLLRFLYVFPRLGSKILIFVYMVSVWWGSWFIVEESGVIIFDSCWY